MWRACKIKGKRHVGKPRASEVEEGDKDTSEWGFFYNFFVLAGWFAPAARQVFHHPPPPQTPFQMRSDPGLGPTCCSLVNEILPSCDVLKPQVQVEHISWFHLLSLQTSDALQCKVNLNTNDGWGQEIIQKFPKDSGSQEMMPIFSARSPAKRLHGAAWRALTVASRGWRVWIRWTTWARWTTSATSTTWTTCSRTSASSPQTSALLAMMDPMTHLLVRHQSSWKRQTYTDGISPFSRSGQHNSGRPKSWVDSSSDGWSGADNQGVSPPRPTARPEHARQRPQTEGNNSIFYPHSLVLDLIVLLRFWSHERRWWVDRWSSTPTLSSPPSPGWFLWTMVTLSVIWWPFKWTMNFS